MNQPDDTRESLLDAAEEVFSQQGFEGASVRAITQRAGANLGAITYHFGSKQALFESVILAVQSGLVAALEAAAAAGGGPGERLERVMRAHFGYLNDHPRIRRLVLQILLRGADLPEPVLGYLRRVIGIVSGIIAEGQASGAFRAGEPTLLAIAVMSQPLMLNIVRPILQRGPGVDLDVPAVRERVLANAVRFARAGLRPEEEVRG